MEKKQVLLIDPMRYLGKAEPKFEHSENSSDIVMPYSVNFEMEDGACVGIVVQYKKAINFSSLASVITKRYPNTKRVEDITVPIAAWKVIEKDFGIGLYHDEHGRLTLLYQRIKRGKKKQGT